MRYMYFFTNPIKVIDIEICFTFKIKHTQENLSVCHIEVKPS